MAGAYHFPPGVFELLIDTIPLLFRSKQGVVLFLRGAGVEEEDLADVSQAVAASPDEISKFEIVRRVLVKVDARGDAGAGPRHEIIRQVIEFESFESCWPTDQQKAKGLVASVREAVNAKDAFARIKNELEIEREQVIARQREEELAAATRRVRIEDLRSRFAALADAHEKPAERGLLIESVFNDLFRAYSIQVREDFQCRKPDSGVVTEQVDGVIELDGIVHLVEAKWLGVPVGLADFSPYLDQLFSRSGANGIFVASSGYSAQVVQACANVLDRRTIFLCSLQEIILLLQRQDDLIRFLKKKSRAAIVDRNPCLEILAG